MYIPSYPFGLFRELEWLLFFFSITLILKHQKTREERTEEEKRDIGEEGGCQRDRKKDEKAQDRSRLSNVNLLDSLDGKL